MSVNEVKSFGETAAVTTGMLPWLLLPLGAALVLAMTFLRRHKHDPPKSH